MTQTQLTKSFITRAQKKFGSKFDYSNVIYNDPKTKVLITCPIHGEICISPHAHLYSKHGCPKCATAATIKSQTKTKNEFITQAKQVWGNFFSYEKVEYKNANTKVIVTCPLHGDFLTRPADFLKHHGCPKCKDNKTSLRNSKLKASNKETLQQKGELLYPGLFQYDKVIYTDSRNKVLIHSNLLNEDFYITPAHFLQGDIPKKYLGLERKTRKKANTESFIQEAKLIHGDLYDYSKSEYKDCLTKVIVTCPKHGDFLIAPIEHTFHRCGCPICASSKGEVFIKTLLDELGIQYIRQYKININETTKFIDFCIVLGTQLVFIEYNGKQHYEPVDIFGGEAAFQLQIKRDADIQEYCNINNIPLYTYKYDIPFYELKNLILNDLNYEKK
jgi:hypothetical protein